MGNKILKTIFVTVFVALFSCFLLCSCEDTEGADNGPIEIATPEDLINIANKMDGNYVLVNNIDLSTYPNWEPIGGAYGEASFSGTLNGNGHSIIGLKRTASFAEKNSRIYFGLFGHVSVSGKITDLSFENVSVSMTGPEVNNSSTKVFCGTLAGAFYGSAEGVDVKSGTMSYSVCTNGCAYTGGLFGLCVGANIKSCSNSATVVSGRYAGVGGGICGYASNSQFDSCKNTGSVSTYCTSFGGVAYSGGIVGEAFSSNPNEYTSCENEGSLRYDYYGDFDPSSSLGGILGWIGGGKLDWSGNSDNIEAHQINQLFQ